MYVSFRQRRAFGYSACLGGGLFPLLLVAQHSLSTPVRRSGEWLLVSSVVSLYSVLQDALSGVSCPTARWFCSLRRVRRVEISSL